MVEARRPESVCKEVARIADHAAAVVKIRNKFAHGPFDMGVNFDTRQFEIYLRHVSVGGKGVLTLDSETLTKDDLQQAYESVSRLYQRLIEQWHEIVDIPTREEIG